MGAVRSAVCSEGWMEAKPICTYLLSPSPIIPRHLKAMQALKYGGQLSLTSSKP